MAGLGILNVLSINGNTDLAGEFLFNRNRFGKMVEEGSGTRFDYLEKGAVKAWLHDEYVVSDSYSTVTDIMGEYTFQKVTLGIYNNQIDTSFGVTYREVNVSDILYGVNTGTSDSSIYIRKGGKIKKLLCNVTIEIIVNNGISLLTADWNGADQINLIFQMPLGQEATIYWGDGNTSSVVGNDSVDVSVTSGYSGGASAYSVSITGSYIDISKIDCNSSNVSGDISGWVVFANLTTLFCGNTSVSVDISSFSGMTSLVQFYCSSSLVSGDASTLFALINLTAFRAQKSLIRLFLPCCFPFYYY